MYNTAEAITNNNLGFCERERERERNPDQE